MTTDDQWARAGTEPRLADMLSDPTTRDLMRADGIDADDVTAVIVRMRHSIHPLELVPPPRAETGAPGRRGSKFGRVLPLHTDGQTANLQAADGVVSRWIASLSDAKETSAE